MHMFKGFQSSDGSVTNEPKAIVPLLKHDETGTSAVGTAFYISAEIIVTAKHCIEEEGRVVVEKGFSILHWELEEKDHYVQRPILGGWPCPVSDIAVLLAAPMHHTEKGHPIPTQSVLISIERPPPGSEVATYAYPNTRVERNGKLTTIRLKPKLVQGRLVDYFPAGRDSAMIDWPVYETDMEIGPGCSGGPVFSENGTAFAVNTSSFEGSEDASPVSYITPIDYILDAIISNVRISKDAPPKDLTVRELAQLGKIEFKPPFPIRNTTPN
jgi:S1-C subfamily serine protease